MLQLLIAKSMGDFVKKRVFFHGPKGRSLWIAECF